MYVDARIFRHSNAHAQSADKLLTRHLSYQTSRMAHSIERHTSRRIVACTAVHVNSDDLNFSEKNHVTLCCDVRGERLISLYLVRKLCTRSKISTMFSFSYCNVLSRAEYSAGVASPCNTKLLDVTSYTIT